MRNINIFYFGTISKHMAKIYSIILKINLDISKYSKEIISWNILYIQKTFSVLMFKDKEVIELHPLNNPLILVTSLESK